MPAHPFDILELESGTKMIFTPCPGTKGATLADSIAQLRAAGTDVVITTMFDAEMEKNQVSQLPTVCENNNIAWYQLPIEDDEAPDANFESQWLLYKTAILAAAQEKKTIAVHCKGGSGRTGLVISLILLGLGLDSQKVKRDIQTMRPNSLKNEKQLGYFLQNI